MQERMAELGRRIAARRAELGLRQQDVQDQAEAIDGPDTTIDVFAIGSLERGQRANMISPREVSTYETILRWPPQTILTICGYLDPRELPETSSSDVIATLMDASDLSDSDKDLVRNMVRGMARRAHAE